MILPRLCNRYRKLNNTPQTRTVGQPWPRNQLVIIGHVLIPTWEDSHYGVTITGFTMTAEWLRSGCCYYCCCCALLQLLNMSRSTLRFASLLVAKATGMVVWIWTGNDVNRRGRHEPVVSYWAKNIMRNWELASGCCWSGVQANCCTSIHGQTCMIYEEHTEIVNIIYLCNYWNYSCWRLQPQNRSS